MRNIPEREVKILGELVNRIGLISVETLGERALLYMKMRVFIVIFGLMPSNAMLIAQHDFNGETTVDSSVFTNP
jgi:hypothetical protein